jgi:protein TonB
LSAANTAPPKVAPQKVRVSQGVLQGNAISQPKPQYPPIARQARISGSVVLQATISKAGTIENLHVISGHPMLIQAAMDAVRQWKYKPYLLNGDPVEVDTQITVNFTMGG